MDIPYLFSHFLHLAQDFWVWARINGNPWKNRSELKKLQEKMFKSLLKHTYENTLFYHRLYKQSRIKPDDIKSLDDIHKLPIVSKQDLNRYPLKERFSRSFDIKRCKEARTSGSTGEPFAVYLEPQASHYLNALRIRRLFAYYGYQPRCTVVSFRPFWAPQISTIRTRGVRRGFLNLFMGFYRNCLSLLDDPFKNLSYIRAIKPDVIYCPPSYLRLIAEAAHELSIEDVRPQIIICGGEMLDPSTRAFIESIFHVKVFDEYGTVDVASQAIAWECDRHDGYHINMDAVYLEFVKDNEPILAGEEGNIIATNLFRYATPMIRYMTDDNGSLSDEFCSCGRGFPMIKSIVGRSDDLLLTPDRRLISPFVVMNMLKDVIGVRRFQLVQEKINRIVVLIDPVPGFGNVESHVLSRCSCLFGNEVQIEIDLGPITMAKGKKYRAVISMVPSVLKSARAI